VSDTSYRSPAGSPAIFGEEPSVSRASRLARCISLRPNGPPKATDGAKSFSGIQETLGQPEVPRVCLPISEEEATEQEATLAVAEPLRLKSVEELRCSLRLRWKPMGRVSLDEKGKLRFPVVAEAPGLYRLRLKTVEGIESNMWAKATTYAGAFSITVVLGRPLP
jgi:hypothetical protein